MSGAAPTRRVYLAHPGPGTSAGLLVRHRVRLGQRPGAGLRSPVPTQPAESRKQGRPGTPPAQPGEGSRQYLADALAFFLGFDLNAIIALVLDL